MAINKKGLIKKPRTFVRGLLFTKDLLLLS